LSIGAAIAPFQCAAKVPAAIDELMILVIGTIKANLPSKSHS
jgi:hypothetical protein